MAAINFTPFPVLTTERLILRQLQTEDEHEFFILKSDERMLTFVDYPAKTFDEARQFLQRLNEYIANNESITWGIALKDENKLIGTICFWNISEADSKAEIGYELMPGHQGQGIMHEAIKTVIEYGFEKMKLACIEALPKANHSQSIKLLERNHFCKEGEDSDMVIYALRK